MLTLTTFLQLVLAPLHVQKTHELHEILPESGTENHTSKVFIHFYFSLLSQLIEQKLANSFQTNPTLFKAFVFFINSSILSPHLVFLYNHNMWCLCTILITAMTHTHLLVFIDFLFSFVTKTPEFDNIDNVYQELIVSQYDCARMQANRMYSLNEVAECKNSAESLYIASATLPCSKKMIAPT